MSASKNLRVNQMESTPGRSAGHKNPRIDFQLLETTNVCAEAERRAAFVRGMGGSVSGYCDGYADGFEHAIQWLLGQISDPLAVDYRPGAGMEFSKKYYLSRPKERAKLLDWFEKIATKPKGAT